MGQLPIFQLPREKITASLIGKEAFYVLANYSDLWNRDQRTRGNNWSSSQKCKRRYFSLIFQGENRLQGVMIFCYELT